MWAPSANLLCFGRNSRRRAFRRDVDRKPPILQLGPVKNVVISLPLVFASSACVSPPPDAEKLCLARVGATERLSALTSTGIALVSEDRYAQSAEEKARATYENMKIHAMGNHPVSIETDRAMQAARSVAEEAKGASMAFLKRNGFSPYRLTFTSRDNRGRVWNSSRYCGANAQRCECFAPL